MTTTEQITPAQTAAIEAQAAIYPTDDAPGCSGLAHYTIQDGDDTFGTLGDGEVEVHFHYRYDDERSPATGLEVTIFAADGTVVASQDFG